MPPLSKFLIDSSPVIRLSRVRFLPARLAPSANSIGFAAAMPSCTIWR